MLIEQIGIHDLPRYASIPIAFRVERILHVEPIEAGMGGLRLAEENVEPVVKDYDQTGGKDTGPNTWAQEFDLTNWGVFLAVKDGIPVGGAAVAHNTAGVNMLEGREDLAVLWDIRVHPDRRGEGIGTALFQHSATWARDNCGCTRMKIETQNVNVAACRFYLSQGCHLGAISRYAYLNCPPVADEVMLLWYFDL